MMSSPRRDSRTQNVAIVGNQHVSRAIIQALSQSPNFRITSVTYRNQEPFLPKSVSKSQVEHIITDFSPRDLDRAFRGQEIVISTISPGDVELQKRMVDACVSVGVRGFIPNEFGLDSQNAAIRERLPAYKARSDMIQYLRTHEARIAWVAIAVGTVLDHELLSGKLGFDLKWRSASVPGSKNAKFPATSLKRVGELVAAVVSGFDYLRDSYLYTHGCMTSAEQVLYLLERETESDWVLETNNSADVLRSAKRMLTDGWPDKGWSLMERSVVFDADMGAANMFLSDDANERFRIQEERLEDIIRETVHEWQHSIKVDCGCD